MDEHGRKRAELAGSWYPGDAAALAATVDGCAREAERRFGVPETLPGLAPAAIVVPHAGLAFSGSTAAVAYGLVRRAYARVDAFVAFGACHRARPARPAIWAEGTWDTPLGGIEVDSRLAGALIAAGAGEPDERAHLGDNAIELQAPFIKRLFPEAMIVPVATPFLPDAWRLGEAAARTAANGRVVVAIASTDLTHYGSAFGLTPAGTGRKALEWIRKNDAVFLDSLARMDLERIVPIADRDQSACGAGAAAAAAGWARARGARSGRVLAYVNSHEIMPRGEADHVVAYASLAFDAPVGNDAPS